MTNGNDPVVPQDEEEGAFEFRDDAMDGLDFGTMEKALVEKQMRLLDTVDEALINELSLGVDEIVNDADRRTKALGLISFVARAGLAFAGIPTPSV